MLDDTAERHIPAGDDFLDPAEVRTLTVAELARRTRDLAPLLRRHAAEAERLRRPVAEVWAAIRGSGFFYQFVPRSFGGLGMDVSEFIDVALPLAMADPATAWSACFCAGHNRTLAHFPAAAQREIWGGAHPYIVAPQLGAPPARAVPADGGYRVTGRWTWGSGIMDADWVIGVVMIDAGEEPPQMAMVVLPAGEADVTDTWHVDGLAGSGSNDVEVTDRFVPAHRILIGPGIFLGRGTAANDYDEPVFHMPLVSFSATVASVPVLGAAKAMLDLYGEGLRARSVRGADSSLSDQPAAQIRLARADLMVSAAESLIRGVAKRGMSIAQHDEDEQVRLRVRSRAELAFAVKLCREAATAMVEGAGSSVHRLDQPFQRLFRDLTIMASHVGCDIDAASELHGRVLLGLQPNTPIF